jgi:hypothetical protein
VGKLYVRTRFSILISILSLLSTHNFASLNFSSRSSSIVINQQNSKLKITNNTSVSGWDQHSIIREAGRGNSWIASNQEFVDTANNHLIYNNSNALLSAATNIFNNSNAISTHASRFISDGETITILGGWSPGDGPVVGGGMFFSSIIDLSGYTFENHGDIHLSSKTEITTSGYLAPYAHAYILGGDLVLPDGVDVTFTTSGIIDGRGHNIVFGRNSSINLDDHVTLTLRHVILRGVKNNPNGGASLGVKRPQGANLTLQDVAIHLERNFSFTYCPLYITGDVVVSGTHTFAYTSTHDMRIAPGSLFGIDMNTTFSYNPMSNSNDLIKMYGETAMLLLTGGTLCTTYTGGLQLTQGTLVVDHKSYINNYATSISEAIIFGDGTADNDLHMEILPGGNINFSGIFDYQNVN